MLLIASMRCNCPPAPVSVQLSRLFALQPVHQEPAQQSRAMRTHDAQHTKPERFDCSRTEKALGRMRKALILDTGLLLSAELCPEQSRRKERD